MYRLKGFMSYGNFADNTLGIVAPLGELSTNSLTFAKEKGFYTNEALAPDTTFVSFWSHRDTGTNPGLIQVPANHQQTILTLGQWIYARSIGGDLTADQEYFLSYCLADFSSVLSNLKCGPMVNDGNGYWMPEWVSYKLVDGEDNLVRVWFSDEAFRQYDSYEIEFVPPIDNLDEFFRDPLEVEQLIKNISLTERLNKVEEKKNRNPYTYLQNHTFEYIAASDRTFKVDTNWFVMIYGPAGANEDIIKEELQKYILENSTHTKEEWAVIFPDIFNSTEFILTPMWDQYSVPNRSIVAGVYSPTTNYMRGLAMAYATGKGEGYNKLHIVENLTISSCMYKSLQFLAVGGPKNRDGIFKFNEKWVDYMAVPSMSTDFGRMSTLTQNWIELLNELLIVAENMDEFSDIPIGMSRIKREGVLYVAASFNKVLYLVVARSSLIDITVEPEEIPQVDPLSILLINNEDELLQDPEGEYLVSE